MSDGTGIVHIAPAFGEDDSRVGREYDLPFVQFVDGKGDLTAGHHMPVYLLRKTQWYWLILKKKASRSMLRNLSMITLLALPLIYYARESWFIKMTAVRMT